VRVLILTRLKRFKFASLYEFDEGFPSKLLLVGFCLTCLIRTCAAAEKQTAKRQSESEKLHWLSR